jgi:hypothetical protein
MAAVAALAGSWVAVWAWIAVIDPNIRATATKEEKC